MDPEYSNEGLAAAFEGSVVLHLEITPEGFTQNIQVVKAIGLGLDEKAVEAVRKWRFAPGLKDGAAVTVGANIEVNFRLKP